MALVDPFKVGGHGHLTRVKSPLITSQLPVKQWHSTIGLTTHLKIIASLGYKVKRTRNQSTVTLTVDTTDTTRSRRGNVARVL